MQLSPRTKSVIAVCVVCAAVAMGTPERNVVADSDLEETPGRRLETMFSDGEFSPQEQAEIANILEGCYCLVVQWETEPGRPLRVQFVAPTLEALQQFVGRWGGHHRDDKIAQIYLWHEPSEDVQVVSQALVRQVVRQIGEDLAAVRDKFHELAELYERPYRLRADRLWYGGRPKAEDFRPSLAVFIQSPALGDNAPPPYGPWRTLLPRQNLQVSGWVVVSDEQLAELVTKTVEKNLEPLLRCERLMGGEPVRGAEEEHPQEEAARALYRSAFRPADASEEQRQPPELEILRQVYERFPDTKHASVARRVIAALRLQEAINLRRQGKAEEADKAAAQGIEVLRPLFEAGDPPSASALGWAGQLYQEMGRLDEAAECYSSILADFPDDPKLVAMMQQRLAEIDVARGEYRQAISRLRRWVTQELSQEQPDELAVQQASRGLDRLFWSSELWEHAVIWYRQWLDGALGPLHEQHREQLEQRLESAQWRAARAEPGERVAAYCRLWQSGYLEELADYHLSSVTGQHYPGDAFLAAVRANSEKGATLEDFSILETVELGGQDVDICVALTLSQDSPPLFTSGIKTFKLRRGQGAWRIVEVQLEWAWDVTGLVEGRVTEAPSGQPLSGQRISAIRVDPTGETTLVSRATTDESGVYTLRLPVGKYSLSYWGGETGYRKLHRASVEVVEGETVTGVDFVLEPTVKQYARGRVLDPQGQPAVNVEVVGPPKGSSQDGTPIYSGGQTDAQGNFDFELPAESGTPRPRAVWARDPDKGLAGIAFVEAPEDQVDIQLAPGGNLVCRAADPQGEPIPNVEVRVSALHSHTRLTISWIRSDERGQMRTGPLPSGIRLWVEPARNLGWFALDEDWRGWGQSILLAPGEERELPPLRLDLAGRSLKGWVGDEQQEPVKGAFVFAPLLEEPVTADESGHFELTGLPVRGMLWIVAAHPWQPLLAAQQVDPDLGFEPRLIVRALGQATGQIVDKQGEPVAGAHVFVYEPHGRQFKNAIKLLNRVGGTSRFYSETVTDQQGKWRLTGLIEGVTYGVAVQLPGDEFDRPPLGELTARGGETVDLGRIELKE